MKTDRQTYRMTSLFNRMLIAAVSLTLIALAGCSQAPNRPEATASSAGTAIELNDAQKRAYLLALDAAAEGNYPSAIEGLKQLTREQPNHPGSWLNLAAIYYEAEQNEPLAHALAQARKLDPENALVHNLTGATALKRGEIEKAEEHYRLAISENEHMAEAHYNLALLLDTYYQDIGAAIIHYQAYLELAPEDEATAQWIEQLQHSIED